MNNTPFDAPDSSNLARRDSSNLARRESSNLARRDTDTSSDLSRRDSANLARRNTSEGESDGINGRSNVQMDSTKLIFKKVRENDTYLKLRRKTQHVGQVHSKTMQKMTDDRTQM